MYQNKAEKINKVISNYWEGIFTGNVEQLRQSFHRQAYLYGDVKGEEYLKSLEEYLDGVAQRKSPSELGEEDRMEVLALEIIGDVAIVKLHAPMLGYNYYDFLSLAVVKGEWKIVNNLLTHVE